jgi:methylated-DNA-[protein]-cysteine S-methyltransferase
MKSQLHHFSKKIKSPVGTLTLVANDEALLAVLWEHEKPNRTKYREHVATSSHPVLDEAERQLKEYFSGARKTFEIKLAFQGTDFQKKVWGALQQIPYGATASYSELARKIGSSKACRAVGAANGRNPLSIIVPCHRVIGRDGKLTGFAGGLENKAFLVRLESRPALK